MDDQCVHMATLFLRFYVFVFINIDYFINTNEVRCYKIKIAKQTEHDE